MNKLLKKICIKKKKELNIIKSKCSMSSLIKLLPTKNNRGFKKLLEKSQKKKINNIIAEIKKSSPSAGEIIKNYYPDHIATQYEKSGVGAISILTEKNFFQGDIEHLSLINRSSNLPILRKDFIIDSYQVYESKVFNADAILLIVSILNDKEIKKFIKISTEIGLDCIVETHSLEELQRALKIGHPIIGINNRNLDNLSININNTIDLIKKIPSDFTIIAESGIKKKEDIKLYNSHNIYNFLIGETILKSENIDGKIKELLS